MTSAAFWRDPALPFAESRRAVQNRACYRPHTHTTLSIGAVDAGRSVFTSQGHSVPLHPGTLVVVPAGCTHACNPSPGMSWSYKMLHLDAAWAEGVLNAARAASWPSHALVVKDAQAYQAFTALNQSIFSSACAQSKEAAIRDFVLQGSWRAGEVVPLAPAAADSPVAKTLALLHAQPEDAVPLPLLAEKAGTSPRALVRSFRAVTGMTPHAYQLDLRVNAARERLRTGEALASVAHELGFYDQSHFHHVFKQHVAATPGEYRR